MSEADPSPAPTPNPAATTLGVVLAAGEGSRFNGPEHKLVTPLASRPLIWWAVHHAVLAGFAEVLVVEGAVPLVDHVPAEASIVHNDDWADGQAGSLQVAVHYAAAFGYDTIVVGVGDQPFVPPEAWRRVAAASGPIAVARFDRQTCPPVKLHADVWGLLPLDGDEGARSVLRGRPDLVTEIPCPGSAVDVDTVVELDQVRRNQLTRKLGTWT